MFGLHRPIRRHAIISGLFLTIGALVPLILTFLLIDFFPNLYDAALRVADPIARQLSTQIFAIHDERTLNAFNATFDSAALVATYIGLIVGALVGAGSALC